MLTEQEIADKQSFTEAFINDVLASIQGAYLVALENGLTLETAASGMDMTPEELEALIWGRSELTLRCLGELVYVLGCEINFEIMPFEDVNKPLI